MSNPTKTPGPTVEVVELAAPTKLSEWDPRAHKPHENDIHQVLMEGILPQMLAHAGGEFTEADAVKIVERAQDRVIRFFDCLTYPALDGSQLTEEGRLGNSELLVAIECAAVISANLKPANKVQPANRGPLIVVP